MLHGSLFAGIGGFDLGFERAGIETTWTVEKDKNCNQVLATHWPDIERHSDVRECGRDNLRPVDIISGGFPCQDLSVAGRREGLAGERSGLWFEFARIVKEMVPQWVVVENVPGLLSSAGGADFALIVGTLEQFGYCVSWRVLDSQFFGVPQRRRRVFIIGSLGGTGSIQVLFESEGSEGHLAEGREEGEGVAATVKASAPSRRGGGSWPIAEEFVVASPITQSFAKHHGRTAGKNASAENMIVTNAFGGNRTTGPINKATACNAHGSRRYDFESETFIAFDAYNQAVTGDKVGIIREQHGTNANVIGIDQSRGQVTGDKANTLRVNAGRSPGVNDGKADNMCVAFAEPGQGFWQDGIAPLRAEGENRPSRPSTLVGRSPMGVRRLTPTECERLQGFPDGWTEGLSDSARYRCLGNAVTVNVAEWMGKRLVGAAR